MPQRRQKSWVEARALIEKGGREYLIIRQPGNPDAPWEFPGGKLEGRESPESALRRLCRAGLGADVEIHVGQPPFVQNFGSHSITYRYYLCGLQPEAMKPNGVEARWVLTQQLRDYHFDPATQQVVDWLLEGDKGESAGE